MVLCVWGGGAFVCALMYVGWTNHSAVWEGGGFCLCFDVHVCRVEQP